LIIFLDGPTSAGKTTVGRLLAKYMPGFVHLEADELRHFAGGLPLEKAISYILEDIIDLTLNWADRGFHVIISWPISLESYRFFIDSLDVLKEPIFPLSLLPSKEIAL
jgi:hypothetical protein